MLNITNLGAKRCPVAILAFVLAGCSEPPNTSVLDDEVAKRSTEEEYREARWLASGYDEHGRKLTADGKERLEDEARRRRLREYEANQGWSKRLAPLESWLDSRLSGNSTFDIVVQVVVVGLAILYIRLAFLGLAAAFAGFAAWALACGVLLLAYGLLSGFQYSAGVVSWISDLSMIFVGVPVFLCLLCIGIYKALTEGF